MKFQKEYAPESYASGIHLALHPGYTFNLKGFMSVKLGLKNEFLREQVKLRKQGQFARGAWECNPVSSAYVQPRLRKEYVHGAVWGVKPQAFWICVKY
jgi:hypothetical protein